MTVTTSMAKVSYAGNGSTTVFAVTFRFLEKSHVVATLRDTNGVETTWFEGTHYTLSGAGGASGTLTVKTTPTDYTPASGETLVITRNVPRTQETDYGENDSFPAETHERALDKLTMLSQQQDESTDRALVVPLSDTAADLSLPIDSLRASKFLAFDATGQPIAAAGTTSDFKPVSAFIDTLLDDGDAATARGTLGAVGLVGNETIAGDKTLSGASTFSDVVDFGALVRMSRGTNTNPGSGTLTLPTNGNYVKIGGTQTVTSIATTGGTTHVILHINGAPTFVHSANLVLPGGQNIVCADGDVIEFVQSDTNEWRCTNYEPVSGRPITGGVIVGTPLVLDPYAANTTTTQAHGLGASPSFLSAVLECKTEEFGWSVGDAIKLDLPSISSSDFAPPIVNIGSSNIVLRTLSTGRLAILNKTTRAQVAITAANWKLSVFPFLVT